MGGYALLGLVQHQGGVVRLGHPPMGSVQVGIICSSSWLPLVKTQISWCLWGGVGPILVWISQWFICAFHSYHDRLTVRTYSVSTVHAIKYQPGLYNSWYVRRCGRSLFRVGVPTLIHHTLCTSLPYYMYCLAD